MALFLLGLTHSSRYLFRDLIEASFHSVQEEADIADKITEAGKAIVTLKLLADSAQRVSNASLGHCAVPELGVCSLLHLSFDDKCSIHINEHDKVVVITIMGTQGAVMWMSNIIGTRIPAFLELKLCEIGLAIMHHVRSRIHHPMKDYSFIFTGHSRGGSLAALLLDTMLDAGLPRHRIFCVSFGAPETRVACKRSLQRILMVIREKDLVPNLPFNAFSCRRYSLRGALRMQLNGEDHDISFYREELNHVTDDDVRYRMKRSYRRISCANGLFLDVKNADCAPCASLQMCNATPSDAQQFRCTSDRYLECKLNLLVLDVAGANLEPRASLQMFPRNGTKAQRWNLTNEQYLECELNGLVLDVANADKSVGAKLQMWWKNGSPAQRWQFQS